LGAGPTGDAKGDVIGDGSGDAHGDVGGDVSGDADMGGCKGGGWESISSSSLVRRWYGCSLVVLPLLWVASWSGSAGGMTLSVGVLGIIICELLLRSVRRREGGLLDGRDSVKMMLAGREKAAASRDWRSLSGVGVPGREPCGDGIRSRS
jgi:hypothetical protein